MKSGNCDDFNEGSSNTYNCADYDICGRFEVDEWI